MTLLINLVGYSGAGKDWIYRNLDHDSKINFKFSQGIKTLVSSCTGVNCEDKVARLEPIEPFNKSALDYLVQDMFNPLFNELNLVSLYNTVQANKGSVIVITDLRKLSELEFIYTHYIEKFTMVGVYTFHVIGGTKSKGDAEIDNITQQYPMDAMGSSSEILNEIKQWLI